MPIRVWGCSRQMTGIVCNNVVITFICFTLRGNSEGSTARIEAHISNKKSEKKNC